MGEREREKRTYEVAPNKINEAQALALARLAKDHGRRWIPDMGRRAAAVLAGGELPDDDDIEVWPVWLTPTELARKAGLTRREVIARCREDSIPIRNGLIDWDQFRREGEKR